MKDSLEVCNNLLSSLHSFRWARKLNGAFGHLIIVTDNPNTKAWDKKAAFLACAWVCVSNQRTYVRDIRKKISAITHIMDELHAPCRSLQSENRTRLADFRVKPILYSFSNLCNKEMGDDSLLGHHLRNMNLPFSAGRGFPARQP